VTSCSMTSKKRHWVDAGKLVRPYFRTVAPRIYFEIRSL
jgi:hypothetical protein